MTKECTHQVGQYTLTPANSIHSWQPIHMENNEQDTIDFLMELYQEELNNKALCDRFDFCPYCGIKFSWAE